MWVKADLHIHSSEDTCDIINISPKFLIDRAKKLNFKILAFTHHEQYFCSEKWLRYAKEKGIFIIQGGEKTLENHDVLIYNVPISAFYAVNTLEELEELKKTYPESLIIAPHPFAPFRSLNGNLDKYNHVFDAIEWTHFYTSYFNCNKKAVKASKRHNLPLIASSDTHFDIHFGNNFSEIEIIGELNNESVINAIKQGRIKLCTNPLSTLELLDRAFRMIVMDCKILLRKLKSNAQNPTPSKCKK